jgi:hypothetical protein
VFAGGGVIRGFVCGMLPIQKQSGFPVFAIFCFRKPFTDGPPAVASASCGAEPGGKRD